jgi:[ribosomal protein S5]-alanine N-acetyltransferase
MGVERRVRPDFPRSCVPYQRTLWALEGKGEMIELETDRMLIRDVRASDADAFHQYMRQEQYWRDAPIEPPTPESVEALVNRSVENQSQSPRTDFFLAAIDKRSEQLVGEAILHVRSIRWRQAEIGWGVSSTHTGRGFATEIGRAMLRHGFAVLGLHRAFAQCRVENLASRRIMAKLGMREEGVMRENVFARGEWWSSAQSSILSTEWRGRTEAPTQ